MRKRWKVVASAALVLGASTTAWGAVCAPDTLNSYFGLGPSGCSLDGDTFSDFALMPASFGASPIDPTTVQVTPFTGPNAAGFLLTLDPAAGGSANAGDLFEAFFSFNATSGAGANFVHAESEIGGSAVNPDGVVTLVDDVCLGGVFAPGTLNCGATPGTGIAIDDGFPVDFQPLASLDFPPVSFIARAVDIVVDGGLAGTAALQSARISFTTQAVATVPEPATLALAGIGLAALGGMRARTRRM